MLIATAGHIDHGKSALIRALTGVETDRLPEERARGISIDLGFAYWRPDGGETIGFIDVPGHRRYLRNMLAGVSGAHFALVVVAADDGIMPQTIEHLQILDLLGISRGVVAITKCDKTGADRIAHVRNEVAGLAGGSLSHAGIFEVSTKTGEGIDEIGKALIEARGQHPFLADDSHGFRMAIDRAFSVTGAGTVVTGTVLAGRARTGDTLVLSPKGSESRIRSIQSGGESVDEIGTGRRCALNLANIEAGELHRGDWLVEPPLHAPTERIEATVRLLPGCPSSLRHAGKVHLHHGAADLGARVLLPGQRALQPGETAQIQLVLDAPTSAVTGERFILRDAAGQELLGGGEVIDPSPGPKRRPLALRQQVAEAMAHPEAASALAELASIPGFECSLSWFARCRNIQPQAMSALQEHADFVLAGADFGIAISRDRLDRLGKALVEALGRHHLDHPEAGGMTRRELCRAAGEPISPGLLSTLLAELAAAGGIDAGGPFVRLPGHVPSFGPAETVMWKAAVALLEGKEIRPIRMAELASEVKSGEAAVRAMLYRRRIAGDVWQVTENRFLLREHVAALAAVASELDARHGGFTAAQFRDASGIGRNFIIELLEFFDRIGVTRRVAEKRHMRAGFEAVVGNTDTSRSARTA